MNHVILAPVNLTRDCESKMTQSGKTVLNFSVAYNVWKGPNVPSEPHFFDVQYWPHENSIHNWVQHLRKGARIAIDGFLRQERWTDKTDGKPRSKVTITASSIVLMSPKQDQAQQPQPVPEPQPQPHNLTGQAGTVADAFGGTEVYEDAPF